MTFRFTFQCCGLRLCVAYWIWSPGQKWLHSVFAVSSHALLWVMQIIELTWSVPTESINSLHLRGATASESGNHHSVFCEFLWKHIQVQNYVTFQANNKKGSHVTMSVSEVHHQPEANLSKTKPRNLVCCCSLWVGPLSSFSLRSVNVQFWVSFNSYFRRQQTSHFCVSKEIDELYSSKPVSSQQVKIINYLAENPVKSNCYYRLLNSAHNAWRWHPMSISGFNLNSQENSSPSRSERRLIDYLRDVKRWARLLFSIFVFSVLQNSHGARETNLSIWFIARFKI